MSITTKRKGDGSASPTHEGCVVKAEPLKKRSNKPVVVVAVAAEDILLIVLRNVAELTRLELLKIRVRFGCLGQCEGR